LNGYENIRAAAPQNPLLYTAKMANIRKLSSETFNTRA